MHMLSHLQLFLNNIYIKIYILAFPKANLRKRFVTACLIRKMLFKTEISSKRMETYISDFNMGKLPR